MKIIKHSEDIVFKDFFEVRKSILQFEKYDGTMSAEVLRYSFSKWDAVGILIYHKERDAYMLVRQMRYPPIEHGIDPWMTEIVAGGISPGEDETSAAIRETEEETGYRPLSISFVMKFYVSPGIMSERISLFYAEVDESSRIHDGGGLAEEDENIELIWLPASEALTWIASQSVGDAKTIAALLWHHQQKLTV